MKKKNIIIIVIVVLLIAIAAGLLIVFKNRELKTPSNSESVNLEAMVNEINELIPKYTGDNLTDNGGYEENDNIFCYKYVNNDQSEQISKLKETYRDIFKKDSEFRIVTSKLTDGTQKENLYICIPKECVLDEITTYEIIKETETDTKKEVKLNTHTIATISKVDNEWKFDNPIMICK